LGEFCPLELVGAVEAAISYIEQGLGDVVNNNKYAIKFKSRTTQTQIRNRQPNFNKELKTWVMGV
jgi:hypothetical protein